MTQHIALITLVVHDYDEAIGFYVDKLGFELREDSPVPAQDKRWVVVTPPGNSDCGVLLAKAADGRQSERVGDQTGGRVALFLYTDDFWRDYRRLRARGVEFIREAVEQPYGTVAVFQDLYGNHWDLLQPAAAPVIDDPDSR